MNARRIVKVSMLSLTLLAMVVAAPMVGVHSVKADEATEKVKVAAEDRKVKLCEAKQSRIKTQLNLIGTKGESQLAVFDSISTKVQAFYKTKGYSVANYDQLVAAVKIARTEATAQVKTAATVPEFDCTKSDPKVGMNAYKNVVKARSEALKSYKTAVHNLLLAVKNSQRQNTTKTTTESTTDQNATETTPTSTETINTTTTTTTTTNGGAN